jgi:hypothetical protein
MPSSFLEGLRPGDRVWVDSRARFMDHRLLREAEFVRWTDEAHPGWHSNEAVVKGPALRKAPQVRPVGDGTFLVDTVFLFDGVAAENDRTVWAEGAMFHV